MKKINKKSNKKKVVKKKKVAKVKKLPIKNTIQNCQFIATTHSPQIIPTVEPEQVFILKDKDVLHPDRSFGMDSNRILNFIMEANDRPEKAKAAIERIESLIKKGTFKEVRAEIANYKNKGLDLPEWSVFEARMAKMEIFGKGK